MSLLLLLRPRTGEAVTPIIVVGRFDSPSPAGAINSGTPAADVFGALPTANVFDPPDPGVTNA